MDCCRTTPTAPGLHYLRRTNSGHTHRRRRGNEIAPGMLAPPSRRWEVLTTNSNSASKNGLVPILAKQSPLQVFQNPQLFDSGLGPGASRARYTQSLGTGWISTLVGSTRSRLKVVIENWRSPNSNGQRFCVLYLFHLIKCHMNWRYPGAMHAVSAHVNRKPDAVMEST